MRFKSCSQKGREYKWENEIRAGLCSSDPVGGQARNYRESDFPNREPQDDLKLRPVYVCIRFNASRLENLLDLSQALTCPGCSEEA